MARNIMKGKVSLNLRGGHVLVASVFPRIHADLPSTVTVRTHNKMTGSVLVIGNTDYDLPSVVQPRVHADLPSTIEVRPHSKMTGLVEVIEPPVIKADLSPIEDTYAREDMPKLNYGRDGDTFVGVASSGGRYRTFLRFDLSSIPKGKAIKKATLKLHLLNSRLAIPVGIYDVLAGEKWTEYGLTWDNQPNTGTLLKTYDSGVYAGLTELDLTSYVSEWYKGERGHNGFAFRTLDESIAGRYKQYGTRESVDVKPVLEIEYFDPTVYSYNRSDLPSSVFVVGRGEYNLPSTVVVNGYVGTGEIPGSVFVRDPFNPVDDDLPSLVSVSRPELPSSVCITYYDEHDLPSSVAVRLVGADDTLLGSVTVSTPERQGSVYVRPYIDLDSAVQVRVETYDEIPFTVTVNNATIGGAVAVRRTTYDELDSVVQVRETDWDEIEWTAGVRAEGFSDLPSSVIRRVMTFADIPSYVEVGIAFNLPSSVYVRGRGTEDLESSVLVTYRGDSEIDGSAIVRVEAYAEIDGSVTVRARRENWIPGIVRVPYNEDRDLPGTVIPRITGVYDIISCVEIADDEGSYAFIM